MNGTVKTFPHPDLNLTHPPFMSRSQVQSFLFLFFLAFFPRRPRLLFFGLQTYGDFFPKPPFRAECVSGLSRRSGVPMMQ